MASAIASTSAYVFPAAASPHPSPASTSYKPQQEPFGDENESGDSETSNDADSDYETSRRTPRRGSTERQRERTPRPRAKTWICSYQGCDKAYARRARLEEHERTHTGERPFACPDCSATFTRDSHLRAHVRSHASEADKNYACSEPGCDKKFWTNQHLKKHVEVAHRGKTYNCTQCDEKFRKHHQLRSHFAEVHCTPGTKPFLCDHPGCDRSFAQKVHLKAHVKTHDPSRYVCLHPDCAALPLAARQYSLWSHLQKHTKSAHPPTCPYPICNGKTFTTPRGLKNHLAIHEREAAKGSEGKDFSDPLQRSNVKRKKSERNQKNKKNGRAQGAPVGIKVEEENAPLPPAQGSLQEFGNDEEGSDWEERQESERDERMREDFRIGGKKKRKVYEDSNGLTQDPFATFGLPPPHPPSAFDALSALLPIPPPFDGRYSPSLPIPPPPAHHQVSRVSSPPPPSSQYLDFLTGSNYSTSATLAHTASSSRSQLPTNPTSTSKRELARKYPCPFPAILGLPFRSVQPSSTPIASRHSSPLASSGLEKEPDEDDEDVEGLCSYWFKRIYDVERHLRSRHGVELVDSKQTLTTWYKELDNDA